ncbi:aminotransferase class IV [Rhodospirillum rubrum]|uniref:Probable branched-chain-amino-acid aminotransferase n=3 Tax=Rhodospirillum rubrum TaxID=1085 RepID=Q2RVB3_RHORT|nr:aminotransferase class IV [Rhodospirillum rubrum]ABC21932.1 branched chain amino acid: 2-keto-4-methylthiobutyrate aminotransferase [Rhodospirillum rubrum ATCC 11170]AEO47636.1 branched chain amino acid: 2-keto-4-methylthiobutyrate aminotransferase [Rhodospirillum rubrum F11]MBK5953498.1 2-keto-4-methylthiobutyrate aminotransferase [Rhodospirillum rubrum]QXG81588.1 aminotransferase class IV [Rhodospirillum rubrum]HCF17547.1 2-keto-4-methylthiobutyrate aminotransferase [Rhodospirillum rubrum
MTARRPAVIWLNDRLVPAAKARIDPADRGFLLGDGLFETIPARDGRPLRLAAHLARLGRGARILGIPLPALDIAAALAATLAANDLSEGVLRLTLTRGPGPRGLLPPPAPKPTIMITATAFPPPTGPARLIVATRTRRNEASPLSTIKYLAYGDAILARQEAAERGADDAILLNLGGRVAETTVATLFIVQGGRLLTPPQTDGALPGILRAEMLAWGAREHSLTPADLLTADGVFLANSLGFRLVISIDGQAVPDCTPLVHDLQGYVRQRENGTSPEEPSDGGSPFPK